MSKNSTRNINHWLFIIFSLISYDTDNKLVIFYNNSTQFYNVRKYPQRCVENKGSSTVIDKFFVNTDFCVLIFRAKSIKVLTMAQQTRGYTATVS